MGFTDFPDGVQSSSAGLKTDTVAEYTSAAGVTVDGLLLKDGALGEFRLARAVASADGAIAVKSGIVAITKGTAAALTLASPTDVTDDGKRLLITATTAAAHTVTLTAGFNGGSTGTDVATFGGAIGDNMEIVAYGGKWLVVSLRNVTLG